MKKHINIIIAFWFVCTGCNGQAIDKSNKKDFIGQLRQSINSTQINTTIIYDTLVIEAGEKLIHLTKEKEKENQWKNLQALFKGTDYIIRVCDTKKYKAIIKKYQGNQIYELLNHKDIYVIGVNKNDKINLIKKIEQDYPPDLPTN